MDVEQPQPAPSPWLRYGAWVLVAVFWLGVIRAVTASGLPLSQTQQTIVLVALGALVTLYTLAAAYALLVIRPALFGLLALILYLWLA